MYAKWMLAPNGYYLSVLVHDNKHIYASGRTPDDLEKRTKKNAYLHCRLSASDVHLEHERSAAIDLRFCSKNFRTRFVEKVCPGQVNTWTRTEKAIYAEEHDEAPEDKVCSVAEEPKKIEEFSYSEEDGVLIVYKVVREEVARYPIGNGGGNAL